MVKYLKAWAYGLFMQEAQEEAEVNEEDAGEGTKGITLIDASHGFNEISRLTMLWTVRHHWPLVARFVLNCYFHGALLIVHRPAVL